MPDSAHHILHTEKNLNFLKGFYKKFEHNDWAITVGFYTALHAIENAVYNLKNFTIMGKQFTIKGPEELRGQLVTNRLLPPNAELSSHKARNMLIQNAFSEIEGEYKALNSMAWQARYIKFSWGQPEAFYAIECYLQNILKWSNGKHGTKFDLAFK